MSLKELLSKVLDELKKKEEVREEILGDMRKVLRLSKEAILRVHRENLDDAERSLEAANGLFVKLQGLSKEYQDLLYMGLVDAAFQEYAEAHTFFRLVKDGKFISPEKFGIPPISYVLGLSDVVGEIRRRALDSLRRGEIVQAEACLEMMEQIYLELTTVDDAYRLVPGLRRKCDIARRVIETTRGDVTIEVRRSALEKSINRLERVLGRKDKVGKVEA